MNMDHLITRIVCVVVALCLLTIGVKSQSHFIPLEELRCHNFINNPSEGPLLFFDEPTTVTWNMTACPMYESTSCCSHDYHNKISNRSDDIGLTIRSQFQSIISSECERVISLFTCLPCAPDSDVFSSTWLSPNSVVTVCPRFCETFYDACKSDILLNGNTVNTTFTNKNYFCLNITSISGIYPFVSRSEDGQHNCFSAKIGTPEYLECTADDIDYHYTECDRETNLTSLEYNWKMNSDCTGAIKLPLGLSNISCPIECPEGEYLPLGETNCKNCLAGSFSLGGGHRVNKWDKWPTRFIVFDTYCSNITTDRISSDECEGWKLETDYIQSNIAGLHNINSILETRVELKHTGNVTFTVYVDSELRYDYLNFIVDDVNIRHITSYPTEGLILNTIFLSQGRHLLQWVYHKDFSINAGEDTAYIFDITVTGMAHHNDYCNDCPAGSSSHPHDSNCYNCPVNTYTSEHGQPECVPCLQTEYSLFGSRNCITREPCTEEDMQEHYSTCTENHNRTMFHTWREPMICNQNTGIHLKNNSIESCGPCNAGHFRIDGDCLPCRSGESSRIGTVGSCETCPAGTYAPKSLNFNRWDEWMYGITTNCTGVCATIGWRLMGDYVDSGIDHGSPTSVSLSIPVEIIATPHGLMTFDIELDCIGHCSIEVFVNNYSVLFKSLSIYTDTDTNPIISNNNTFNIPKDLYNITFIFTKYLYYPSDRAILRNLVIKGVNDGGADECVSCPPGSASKNERSEKCPICQPGSFADGFNNTICSLCPPNTHAPDVESDTCIPCGHGTFTSEGSAQCSIGECKFNAPDTIDVYDLTPLKRESMWGPINDKNTYIYYINPCQISSKNECIDYNGTPLYTYACEHNVSYNFDMDLGHTLGFYEMQDERLGVIMALTDGSNIFSPLVPNNLNITFICDPSVGIGFPSTINGYNENHHIKANVCTYALEWRSIYACPLCREDHYKKIVGTCTNQMETLHYEWRENPKKCHSGVALPSSVSQGCTSIITCAPGTHLDSKDICVPCEDGTFSYGNAHVYSNWTQSMEPLVCNSVFPDCWRIGDNGVVTVGSPDPNFIGNASTIQFSQSFMSSFSQIEFVYQTVITGSSSLSFIIDDVKVLTVDHTTLGWKTFKKKVSPVTHLLRWQWIYGDEQMIIGLHDSAQLRSIKTVGSISSVSECKLCPIGLNPSPDRASCVNCQLNRESLDGRSCTDCTPEKYSLPGDVTCLLRQPCTNIDFLEFIPNVENIRCNGNNTSVAAYNINFELLIPSICLGSLPSPIEQKKCIPCPYGMVFREGNCLVCPNGQFFNDTTLTCQNIGKSMTTSHTAFFFHAGDIYSTIPNAITTNCYGDCGSEGFRLESNGQISSGMHSGSATIVLDLSVDIDSTLHLLIPPIVSFDVIRKVEKLIGLEVYIYGQQQSVPYTKKADADDEESFLFAIPQGVISFQPTVRIAVRHNIKSSPSPIYIKNLLIKGTNEYGSIGQQECTNGYAIKKDINKCVACPVGTYSSLDTSNICTPCSDGEVSQRGSQKCTKCSDSEIASQNICVWKDCHIEDVMFGAYNINLNPIIMSIKSNMDFQISFCNPLPFEESYDYPVFALLIDKDLKKSYPVGGHDYKIDIYADFINIFFAGDKPFPLICNNTSTTLKLQCIDTNERETLTFTHNDICNIKATLKTRNACHLCTEDEYMEEKTACVGGKQKIIYVLKEGFICVLPNADMSDDDCNSFEISGVVAIGSAIAVILIIIVSTFLVFSFWKSKKNVEAKYAKISNDIPLDDFDDVNNGRSTIKLNSSDSDSSI